MNSTWLRGSRAPRVAALIIAALPTLLAWAATRSAGLTEEVTFGWFAYTPLSMDYLFFIIRMLDWMMVLIQVAAPALVALLPLLLVRRWTSWSAGVVLLIGGLLLGGARLLLGSGPSPLTPGVSPMYAALGVAACYVVAAILLFLAAIRLTPPTTAAPATAPPTDPNSADPTPSAPDPASTAHGPDAAADTSATEAPLNAESPSTSTTEPESGDRDDDGGGTPDRP